MGIGMLVLYAALAVVGLWLLAELLLQSRAPLHWRAQALLGFLLVVAGMGAHSTLLVGCGALVFLVGQLLTTLAVRAGRTTAWSLRGADGSLPGPLAKVPLLSAATDGAAAPAEAPEPARVGEVGPIEDPAADAEPLPEPAVEEGDYGIYDTAGGYQGYEEQAQQPQQQPEYGYQQAYGGYYEQQPQPYQEAQYQQPAYQEYGGYAVPDQQQWQQQPQPQPYEQGHYQTGYEQQHQQHQVPQEYYQEPQQPQQQPYQQTEHGWQHGWQ
ncbi:hypothetical protein ACFYNO_02655 [Kitasatospora sp. NPDC006697]|uniref:hypothetical protein n=1 Tax=Kitasatospora sp. NPDC006697 TaxID=3364020 RepID=UPI00367E5839